MNRCTQKTIIPLYIALLIFFTSCATLPGQYQKEDLLAYTAEPDESLFRRHLPVFMIKNHRETYNRIGTPSAKIVKESKAEIFINPEIPTIYTEKRNFNTPEGSYTNLIYRIHFEKIPIRLIPFYLSAGENVGVMVVVTLNSAGLPILYTTVQTCGCYLAFIPTSYMAQGFFPVGWNKERQKVYGENLTGLLDFKGASPDQTVVQISLRNGTHRVKEVSVLNTGSLKAYKTVNTQIKPLRSLENLPLEDVGTTSFYDHSTHRKGYVVGSFKHWERLLMSWWALDWRVGQDKKLGADKTDGPVFYTSLKPWARDDSDMRDFPAFLKYWGWTF